MVDLVERRWFVPCVRDFPKGCGPHAAVVEWISKEAPPPAVDFSELAARKTVPEPPAGPGSVLPDVQEKSPVSARNVEAVDFATPVGCSEPWVVRSPVRGFGSIAAAGVDRERKADRGMRGSSNQHDKLGPKASGVCGTDGSLKNQCIPRRRAVSAVRYFPIGCGASAPRMTTEQVLKLVAAASSKGKSPTEDKLPKDQQPMATENLADAQVPADNEVAEGMKERIEVRNIKEETVEGVKESKVSKSLFGPNIKRLEVEKKRLVVKKTSFAVAVPDKRLNEQPIEPLRKNLEAQTSKNPGSDELVNCKRLSSRKSTDRKVLVKSEKLHKIIKRNVSDATADKDHAKMNQKQGAENLKVHGERVIIQALMASPNCLWRQGRRLGISTTKSKMKRVETTAVQLVLPKPKTEGTTSDTQLALG